MSAFYNSDQYSLVKKTKRRQNTVSKIILWKNLIIFVYIASCVNYDSDMISNALQFLHNFWKFKIKKLESLKMKYNKWIVEIDKEVCISNFIWERESKQNTFSVTTCSFHVIFFSFVWNDMLDPSFINS